MDAKIVVAPAIDAECWVWAVIVDGGEYASGEADDEAHALKRANAYRREWRAMNEDPADAAH